MRSSYDVNLLLVILNECLRFSRHSEKATESSVGIRNTAKSLLGRRATKAMNSPVASRGKILGALCTHFPIHHDVPH